MNDDNEDYYDRKVEKAAETLALLFKVAAIVLPVVFVLDRLGVMR